jgi:hypothetical protein
MYKASAIAAIPSRALDALLPLHFDPPPLPNRSLHFLYCSLYYLRDSGQYSAAADLLSAFASRLQSTDDFFVHDVDDSDVTALLLSFFDPCSHPLCLAPLLMTLTGWTCHTTNDFSQFESHPLLFDYLFHLGLLPASSAPPPGCEALPAFQCYAIQVIANLLEDSASLCDRFRARDGFSLYLESVAPDDVVRLRCVLRVFSAFIRTRPVTRGMLDRRLFEALRPRFEHDLTLCESDDFFFLERYVSWSAWARDYFLARVPLPAVFDRLGDFADDQIERLLRLLWKLLLPLDGGEEDALAWTRVPFAAFVRCYYDGFRLSRVRSAGAKLAFVKFVGKVLARWPEAVREIAGCTVVGLLSRWIRDDAVTVRTAAARLFCAIGGRIRAPLVVLESSIVDSLIVLLVDLDVQTVAEEIVACIGRLVDLAVEVGGAACVLECFARSAVWERLGELAVDPDVEVGERAIEKIAAICRRREELERLEERDGALEETRKLAQIKVLEEYMPGTAEDGGILDGIDEEYDFAALCDA